MIKIIVKSIPPIITFFIFYGIVLFLDSSMPWNEAVFFATCMTGITWVFAKTEDVIWKHKMNQLGATDIEAWSEL